MGDSKGGIKYVKNGDLTFLSMYKKYVEEHELFSLFHFFSALIFAIAFILFINFFELDIHFTTFYDISISASTDIFAILIAAFGLFAAITDKKFIEKIYTLGQLRNVLFPFWLCSVMWIINLFFSLFSKVVLDINTIKNIHNLMFFISFFFFMLSIGYTLGLIGDVLKLTVFKTQIDHFYSQMGEHDEAIEKIDENYSRFIDYYTIYAFTNVLLVIIWVVQLLEYRYLDIVFYLLITIYIILTSKLYRKLKSMQQLLLIRRVKSIGKICSFSIAAFLVFYFLK